MMPHIADKPFMNVLAEDVRVDPQQGVLGNIGNNLARAGDKMIMRNQYRDRARQMNLALQDWQRTQAILRQRQPAVPQQLPYLWPRFLPPQA
jgi:hypothetical protein